jgi:hypothetical protein
MHALRKKAPIAQKKAPDNQRPVQKVRKQRIQKRFRTAGSPQRRMCASGGAAIAGTVLCNKHRIFPYPHDLNFQDIRIAGPCQRQGPAVITTRSPSLTISICLRSQSHG